MSTRRLTAAAAAMLLVASAAASAVAAAAPPAVPVPAAPTTGSTVVTPAFSWGAVDGVVSYEVQVGPASDPVRVTWTATTPNTAIVPTDAAKFAAGALYWRVRARGAGGTSAWSAKKTFTKSIPAPDLTAPGRAQNVTAPLFRWTGPLAGVASYKLEISAKSTFSPIAYSFATYYTGLAPKVAITPGNWYWRVRSVDADGHVGAPSATGKFVQVIDVPELVAPATGAHIAVPTLGWKLAQGAVAYKVELATAAKFASVAKSFTTSGLSYTPTATLADGTWYWRVRGVDAAGKTGAPGLVRSFVLSAASGAAAAPDPLTPGDGESVAGDPALTWSPTTGAARYRLRVSTSATFSPAFETVGTAYPAYAPAPPSTKPAYPDGTYHWRVEALAASGSVLATGEARSFTVARPVTLTAPADAATVPIPVLSWEQAVGAKQYRVVVSTSATLAPAFDSMITTNTTYIPNLTSLQYAYPEGTYFWSVEARASTGAVLAASAVRSFTVAPVVGALSPADGATLAGQPHFAWQPVEGAKSYRLVLSTSATFDPVYASVTTDYTEYVPCAPSGPATYPIGTYYWRVEARSARGSVLATTATRSVTVTAP